MKKIILALLIAMTTTAGLAYAERYTRSSSGIVTDTETNLQWQDHYVGGFDSDNYPVDGSAKLKWAAALEYCHDLVLGGHSDWRVPSYNELFSMITSDDLTHWTMFEENKRFSHFWSSTTYSRMDDHAWTFHPRMRIFYFPEKDYSEKTNTRCVREQ